MRSCRRSLVKGVPLVPFGTVIRQGMQADIVFSPLNAVEGVEATAGVVAL